MPDECDTNITEEKEEKEEEEESRRHNSNEWPQAPCNAAYKETGLSVYHGALKL